jgi:hypothetical protein
MDTKCRMCYKAEEHIKYVVARSTTLALSEYINRHNKVAGCIHWAMCKHMGLQVTDKYYAHIPERAINVNGNTIMCDIPVIRVRKILTNQL